MAHFARLPWIIVLAGFVAASAQAAPVIGSFAPEYPALFAPIDGFGQHKLRALTVWGAPAAEGTEVRIDATCGEFASWGPSMVTVVDSYGWVSDQYAWRSPSQEQDCTMVFTEVGGDASFTLPIHVYDPATVVMATDFGESLVTEAARPFEMTLAFHTAAGLPIMNNLVIPMVSKTEGASAEGLYISYPTTTVDGIQYVSGVANNAVGEYEIIIELQYSARWFIPVYQGVPLPASRRHWGPM